MTEGLIALNRSQNFNPRLVVAPELAKDICNVDSDNSDENHPTEANWWPARTGRCAGFQSLAAGGRRLLKAVSSPGRTPGIIE